MNVVLSRCYWKQLKKKLFLLSNKQQQKTNYHKSVKTEEMKFKKKKRKSNFMNRNKQRKKFIIKWRQTAEMEYFQAKIKFENRTQR